jgi:hypothetical protein
MKSRSSVLKGDNCLCSGAPYKGCGLRFTSAFSFDTHRVGMYTPNTRRCSTPVEMRAIGMTLTEKGWRIIGG